ncbi:hypothetical protein C9439_01335 [archaeon SCG-AAA382B04]|nr:hypothetical protein C9439_01335 [archaeon SCG-AAA382B04]
MYIGKINRIFDYDKWLVRAADKEEARDVPIGSFIRVNDSAIGAIVGHIQDVPDDYLANEITGETSKNIFINELGEENAFFKVLGIGELNSENYKIKAPPRLKQEVYLLEDEDIREFHKREGEFSFEYYSDIIDFEKIEPEIIVKILDQLEKAFRDSDETKKLIDALKKHTRRIK